MTQARKYSVVSPSEAKESPYPYVYVNDDGTVRELHEAERKYLEEPFSPYDGARPNVKGDIEARDGWGSVAGYCHRSAIPLNLQIANAPLEDPFRPMSKAEHIEWLKKRMPGFEVVERADGTVVAKRLRKE